MIDLREDHLKMVRDILLAIVPDCEVRVYGSRVNGTASPYSDLDLAIIGKEKLHWEQLCKLTMTFRESLLPYHVDVFDWHAIPEEFKESINQQYEVIQNGKV
jgi:predicted nucleotidyltransferase